MANTDSRKMTPAQIANWKLTFPFLALASDVEIEAFRDKIEEESQPWEVRLRTLVGNPKCPKVISEDIMQEFPLVGRSEPFYHPIFHPRNGPDGRVRPTA
jgi:hypothetical protein